MGLDALDSLLLGIALMVVVGLLLALFFGSFTHRGTNDRPHKKRIIIEIGDTKMILILPDETTAADLQKMADAINCRVYSNPINNEVLILKPKTSPQNMADSKEKRTPKLRLL